MKNSKNITSALETANATSVFKSKDIFKKADFIRNKFYRGAVLLRGIIEFSNYCCRNCLYCGLRRDNRKIKRYRLSQRQIIDAAGKIHEAKVKTVILQSGDDFGYTREKICRIVRRIKTKFPDLAITLSIGERPLADYRAFKAAGADRYLLKHETANPGIYARLHPGQSLKSRIRILKYLKKLGYAVGAGNIVGLPGQSAEDLVKDVLFLRKMKVEMAGIGPFIPQSDTPLGNYPAGDLDLTLRVLALARIILKRVNLPATTALVTSDRKAGQLRALKSGANVLMCNFTPEKFRKNYRIYDGKEKVSLATAKTLIRQVKRTWA
jgi:biotin synthase